MRFCKTGIVWWIVSVMGDYIWRYEMANTCTHGIRALYADFKEMQASGGVSNQLAPVYELQVVFKKANRRIFDNRGRRLRAQRRHWLAASCIAGSRRSDQRRDIRPVRRRIWWRPRRRPFIRGQGRRTLPAEQNGRHDPQTHGCCHSTSIGPTLDFPFCHFLFCHFL